MLINSHNNMIAHFPCLHTPPFSTRLVFLYLNTVGKWCVFIFAHYSIIQRADSMTKTLKLQIKHLEIVGEASFYELFLKEEIWTGTFVDDDNTSLHVKPSSCMTVYSIL